MKLCGVDVGLEHPFFLIAGPCVIESEQLQMDTAGTLKEITSSLGIPFIFKSSFDKANRSSGDTFRGPGMEQGLEILAKVKRELGVPVLTDVHDVDQIAKVASIVDVLQTPAFLCRQTDFIRAVAQSGKPVNIKKGQFLAPHDMKNVIDKAPSIVAGKDGIIRVLVLSRLDGGQPSAPNRLGGEVQRLALPGGGQLFTAPAVWRQHSRTTVFIGDEHATAAYALIDGKLQLAQ